MTECSELFYSTVALSINSFVSSIFLSIFRHLSISTNVLWNRSNWPFDELCKGGAFTISMLYWFFNMVSELNEGSLSQYIVLMLGNIFTICNRGPLISTIVLDIIGCTKANLENLSTQVKNCFLSVENMSMCNISPVRNRRFAKLLFLGMSVLFCLCANFCNLRLLLWLNCSCSESSSRPRFV